MVSAAATTGGQSRTVTQRGNNSQAPVVAVPFIRASSEHREPTGIDISRLITASDQDLGVFDIPAIGYVRSLLILVQAASGAGTGAVAAEDGPWSALKNIAFTEPNGAQLTQFSSGYSLYLANKWGGYRNALGADPKKSPVYSAVTGTGGNFSYWLRIPVELNLRDALGSLPNQNAASTFKLRLTLAGSAQIYGTPPATTLPTARIRVFSEVWDQPEPQSGGQANATTPPAVNTTQFWSEQTINYNSGAQNLRLSRVGNYLRNVILVARRAGSRANGESDLPDPLSVQLDTRPIDIIEKNNWINQLYERTGYGAAGVANEAAGGLDNGVRTLDFCHEFSGLIGQENRDLWLETMDSTRLELQGSWGTAGSLTILTNDVSVAGPVFL